MKKILLVEDSPKVSVAISMSLKAMGYEVKSVTDAIFVVTQARQFAPDLIILDINLPGGDGFVVSKRLQTNTQTSGVPFIFITASKKEGLREQAMAAGAHEFLEKPFGVKELVGAIESAFEKPSEAIADIQIG